MAVIKRNGSYEEFDISKIRKQTQDSTNGLKGTSYEELELDLSLRLVGDITSSEIQQSLIKVAVDKIDIDAPNWSFVAARLFLYDLYHRVNGYTGYGTLEEYFDLCESEGRIQKDLRDKFDLEELDAYIDYDRDMQFTYLGIRTLYDRYLLKNELGDPIELPQHMFMAIAMFLAQNEKKPNKWAKKFYDMISKFEVMMATPTLSNARTLSPQLCSCFVGSTADNLTDIFGSYADQAQLSKYGGGIGWDWTRVRALGSTIAGHKGAAAGVIPALKIENDIANYVDQLGTRKGAINVYLETWHMDIYDFLDLKKNSGEERRRAHDLFTSVWASDLFMERVEADADWTLFDPYDTPDLSEVFGDAFRLAYESYENSKGIRKRVVKAKELWRKIIISYFETGSPFLGFKDTVNDAHMNPHKGLIRSSNLCMEYLHFTDENNIAVCNLASVNLSKINSKEDIDRIVPVAMRALDNVIDLNFYPVEKAKNTHYSTRSVGLGIMGEAQMVAEKQIEFGSEQHEKLIDSVLGNIRYAAEGASQDLAEERGVYPAWKGSKWEAEGKLMRNGYIMAIAPTSSISILVGTTQSIEPIYKRKWYEENLSGLIPVVAPNLSPDTWAYYTPAYEVDQMKLVKLAAIRQKWVDQGQSLNIFVDPEKISGKYLSDLYMYAWKLKVKTTYYLRSKSPEDTDSSAVDRSMECSGCQ
jgi:ribonucleoside-diphosphate reductase alpha chain